MGACVWGEVRRGAGDGGGYLSESESRSESESERRFLPEYFPRRVATRAALALLARSPARVRRNAGLADAVRNSYSARAMTTQAVDEKTTHALTWQTPVRSGNPPAVRNGHTADVIDSKIYIFGGTRSRPPVLRAAR